MNDIQHQPVGTYRFNAPVLEEADYGRIKLLARQVNHKVYIRALQKGDALTRQRQ